MIISEFTCSNLVNRLFKNLLIFLPKYSFRERREKYDIVWNSNGTVTYRQNRTFSFVPEMSNGNESDMIMTINPVVAVSWFVACRCFTISVFVYPFSWCLDVMDSVTLKKLKMNVVC